MLNRVFKTIFILTLCLGITLPTNAAVSVSDGSAFITKSEFNSDLNNLSNRMAQLENSLDAKIDSLVSSYLTRNGIWNGAKQTMVNDTGLSIRYGFVNGGSYNAKYFFNYANDTVSKAQMIYKNRTMNSVGYTPTNTTYNFINQISKSGMLFLNTSISNHRVNDNRCYMSSVNSSTVNNFASDHFRFIYIFSIIYQINGVEAAKTSCSLILGSAGIFLDVPRLASGSTSFFVAKDDVITVKAETTLNTDAGTAHANSVNWLNGNGYATYDYNIYDAYVY